MRILKLKENKRLRSNDYKNILAIAGKYKTLSVDEEVELAEKVINGDQKAKEKLIYHNLKFVISVAKQYSFFTTNTISMDDIISEGILGLIRAIETYDPTKGFKFISYAVWWIRQSIIKNCSENFNSIRIPMTVNRFKIKVSKIREQYSQKYEREISEYEILEILEEKGEKYIDLPSIIGSIDDTATSSERVLEFKFSDVFKDEESDKITDLDRGALIEKIKNILNPKKSKKTERNVQIFLDVYYSNLDVKSNITAIASKIGCCRERARQIHAQFLQKLKRAVKDGILNADEFFE